MAEKGKPHIHLLPALRLARARALRRNQTPAEAKLWRLLHNHRLLDFKFRRNHPIGSFFADFCCLKLKARLVIEVDGGQHANREEADYDSRRTAYLQSQGFRVLRFWNHEVSLESERVIEQITEALHARSATTEPSP